jgi:hypothetical protein
MILRNSPPFKQAMAENGLLAIARFARGDFARTVMAATIRGFGLVRISPFNYTPSYGGQLASPSAALSVLFWRNTGQGRERQNHVSRVVSVKKRKKGLQVWVFPKLYLHSQWQQGLLLAGIQWVIKRLAAQLSVREQLFSPAAVYCKARQLVQGQTCLPARPKWSAANNLNTGAHAPILSNVDALLATCQQGILRFNNLFHHQKGPAYV